MKKPKFIKHFLAKADALIEKKSIGDVLFSDKTYEVEVQGQEHGKKIVFWPFLQINDDGELLDFFCTCKTSEEGNGCEHLTAAYLSVCDPKMGPLHVRFKQSFFYWIFFLAGKQFGFESQALTEQKPGHYFSKNHLFSIEAKNAKATTRLQEYVKKKSIANEETSLKLSTLSPEEIAQYKEGKASLALQYELSFWSDIGKWLFWMQVNDKPYHVDLLSEGSSIPNKVVIKFEEVEVVFLINKEELADLILYLKSISCPLQVHDLMIEKIFYDPIKKLFTLRKKEFLTKDEKEKSIKIRNWYFIPNRGFFRTVSDPIWKKNAIAKEKIASFLTMYSSQIEPFLSNAKIHRIPVSARYHLFFDKDQSLHIQTYVFEHGDLNERESAYFEPWEFLAKTWVYLSSKEFYLLEDVVFPHKETIIPKEKISEFVNQYRLWLHNFEGFSVHFGDLLIGLSYSVKSDHSLFFDAELEANNSKDKYIDLGEYIYIGKRGFYSKTSLKDFRFLKPGMKVLSEDVSTFIQSNREELEQIEGFFTEINPIESIGLSVFLDDDLNIEIKPKISLKEKYSISQLIFYDDYVYLRDFGFFNLPTKFRLPDKYKEEKVISSVSQKTFFLDYEIDSLQPLIKYLDSRLQKPKDLGLQIVKIVKERKLHNYTWLVELVYTSEKGSVHVTDIWQALHNQQKYIFSSAGLISLKDSRYKWIGNLKKSHILPKTKRIRFNTLDWLKFSVFEDIQEPTGEDVQSQKNRSLLGELKNFETEELLDVHLLKANLRQYQEFGVKWLWFLYCHGLSGLLCDDMGLGKTHQAMGLMAAVCNEDSMRKNKYLVVCPTSVIYHWEELLKRFLPNMRVCTYHGLVRTKDDFEQNYDVLLTSYGILRIESDEFSKLPFELAIFDEIQIAKNHTSQVHKSLEKTNAKMRLGLTGTPIENRVRELKAIFDIILPSYLPKESVFREIFINPIEKEQDDDAKLFLYRLIYPFVMRRKKTEVLLELPEKIEEIAYCDLSQEQSSLYYQLVKSSKDHLMKEVGDNKSPTPFMHIFSLLSSLKQICDHPALFLKDQKSYIEYDSGKWELFLELLNEARDSGQKLVVFSQYLGMLDIIEAYLKKKKIGFASIKGATKKRAEEIKKFRDDPQCEVFVASLLAAGVGIDLSCASVVIHYDRWWNPAKENQATDRVHRLGQNRGVQVFKLVTKNTIEEHIHDLIERKQGLIDDMIGQDDSDQIKYLNKDELLEILEKISKEADEADF